MPKKIKPQSSSGHPHDLMATVQHMSDLIHEYLRGSIPADRFSREFYLAYELMLRANYSNRVPEHLLSELYKATEEYHSRTNPSLDLSDLNGISQQSIKYLDELISSDCFQHAISSESILYPHGRARVDNLDLQATLTEMSDGVFVWTKDPDQAKHIGLKLLPGNTELFGGFINRKKIERWWLVSAHIYADGRKIEVFGEDQYCIYIINGNSSCITAMPRGRYEITISCRDLLVS